VLLLVFIDEFIKVNAQGMMHQIKIGDIICKSMHFHKPGSFQHAVQIKKGRS
jgi:hypothetical protein